MTDNGLSTTETALRTAFSAGRMLDLRGDGAADGRPQVPADVLTALLRESGTAEAGRFPVLRLAGAHIVGDLELDFAEISTALWLENCRWEGDLQLRSAKLRALTLVGCVLGDVNADGVRIGGSLTLTRSNLRSISLRGAEVLGNVELAGADLGGASQVGFGGDRLRVEGDVDASRLTCAGEFRLVDASVRGSAVLQDLTLRSADGIVLNCAGLRATTLWLKTTTQPGCSIDMRGAKVGELHDDALSWAAGLGLSGLVYRDLQPQLPAQDRLGWLRRNTAGYQPQPYDQLAACYRRQGQDGAAQRILLAKGRDRRAQLPWTARLSDLLFDVLVGYGHRPLRAAGWLVLLVTLGTVVFSWRPPPILDTGHQPHFSPFNYTLDLLIPIVNLGQENEYSPTGGYQTFASLLVASGWLLLVLVAAGGARWAVRTFASLSQPGGDAADLFGTRADWPETEPQSAEPAQTGDVSLDQLVLQAIHRRVMVQAQVSFMVSVLFASVGAIILLGGVGLAIYHADSNGDRYAAIVASTAGIVINLCAGMFYYQSNRAQREVTQQGVSLRADAHRERRLLLATENLDKIEDPALRDQARSEMALHLLTSADPQP